MSEFIEKSRPSTRAQIITTLERIQQGESLAGLLEPLLQKVAEKDKGFTHELLLGTLRQWWALSRIGESLIEREVTDKGVIAGLNIGLYQLLYMDTPDYAAIGETVEAIKQLDKGYGAGLINAILRKVQKNPEKFRKKIEKNHSLPNWLAKQIKTDWAESYQHLGQALRQPAPIFLRVNAKFCTLADYVKLLDEQGIGYQILDIGFADAQSICLTDNVKVTALPHFSDGWVSVQDRHAQLSAHILTHVVVPNAQVLDACAAPGGKTAHLLELSCADNGSIAHLTALDNDEKRLGRVYDNLQRLGLLEDKATKDKVTIITHDACQFTSPQPFDVILLDAPCTATGVIRRHPDIALLRQEDDVAQTAALQKSILDNLWQSLKPTGYLLYVTCSLLKAENEQQIEQFLATHKEATLVDFTLSLPNQIKRPYGYQCLPLNDNDGDGFYYALLQKDPINY